MKTTTAKALSLIASGLLGVLGGYYFGQWNYPVPPTPEYSHNFILIGCFGETEWLIEITGPHYAIAHASQIDVEQAVAWAESRQPLVLRVPRKVCM